MVSPWANTQAIQECSRQSEAAIAIAKAALENAQVGVRQADLHGAEAQDIRDDISHLEGELNKLHSIESSDRRWRLHSQLHEVLDRRVSAMEP